MGLDIERQLFKGIKQLLETNTYISTNSVPVKDAGDNSQEKTPPCVFVDTVNMMPENMRRDKLWKVGVVFGIETYIPNDTNKDNLYAIYQEVLYEVCKRPISDYNAYLSTIELSNIIIDTPTRQNIVEQYQQIFLEVNFHVTEK